MSKTILIAGGSGLIGTFLRDGLQSEGHQVRILSRDLQLARGSQTFLWNPKKQLFDHAALEGVDVLVNLVGASIADGRWTSQRKKMLKDSRVYSTNFLFDNVIISGQALDAYVGSSAVGLYGDRADEILTEHSASGESSFLVDLCKEWESAHDQFTSVAKSVTKLRTGVVLSNQGGAWPEMNRATVGCLGAYFGKGNQYMPWIHIHDLIQIMVRAISDPKIDGVVNGSGPNPVTNRNFVRSMIRVAGYRAWLVSIPSILLKLGMGAMSSILLDSQRVIPEVMQKDSLFEFKYQALDDAIRDLNKNKSH